MFFVFFSLTLCLVGLYALGNGLLAALRLDAPRNPWLVCWLGFFFLSLAAIPVSFFVPLSGCALAGLALFSLVGWKRTRADALAGAAALRKDRAARRYGAAILLLGLLLSLAVAYLAWPVHQYDTDLYHAQIVRWLNTYGMPFGLGNLHSRLANNSAWLDVAALLDNGCWDGRSAWIMTGLLLCLTLFYFLHELVFSPHGWAKIYALCMFPAIFFIPETTRPNLYYDSASMLLCAILVLETIYFLFQPRCSGSRSPGPRKEMLSDAAVLLGLTALAFMIKTLAAAAVLAVPCIVVWKLAARRELRPGTALKVFFLPLLAACLWVGKNLVLSGYPLFPLPLWPMPFDWTMRLADVRWCYDAVRGYARMHVQMAEALEHGITYWFPYWWDHQWAKNSFRSMMLLPFLGACVAWGAALARRRSPEMLALLVWQIASLACWFITAPDPRFGFGFAWAFLASGASVLVLARGWELHGAVRWGFVFLAGLLAARLFMDIRKAPHTLWVPERIPPRPVAAHLLEGNGAPFWVFVPVEGNKCGDATLPCAEAVPQNLCRRSPDDLGQGFKPCAPL